MTEVQEKPTLGVRFRGRCPPHRELKNITEEQQGPTLSVRFREVSVLERGKEYDWRTAGSRTLGVPF